MTDPNAAGRKTDEPKPRFAAGLIEARLEAQLDILTEGMRDALKRANTIPLDYDENGFLRKAEFENAINVAKTSASLVLALAKLNGQFNHDINVRHVAADPPPPPKV
ncbi:MAG: hypothetical protein WDN01_16010 [Rhizomicrobium sp.]